MSNEGYDYERLRRERGPHERHPSDGSDNTVNIRQPLLDRPAEGSDSSDYSYVDSRAFESCSFSRDGKSGPPPTGDESGSKGSRDDHSTSSQPEHRDMREDLRRSFDAPHYVRDRSPHKRETPFFRHSPVGGKDSPRSRFSSSDSRSSYSSERSETYPSGQSQSIRQVRPFQPLRPFRGISPSKVSSVVSSEVIYNLSRQTEKELNEAARKWATEELQKANESNLPKISEHEAGPAATEVTDQPEPATDTIELLEDSELNNRSKVIASKVQEIQQAFQQDCETFAVAVNMLIDKDPSLENSIQFSLRQNLQERSKWYVEELKHFIEEYDPSSQEFGGSGQLPPCPDRVL